MLEVYPGQTQRYIDAPVLRFRDGNIDGDYNDAGDDVLYYANDANMNVTGLVDADTGSVVERYEYTTYGEVTVLDADFTADADNASDFDNRILYCGYRHDPATGLYHVRHRYYHCTLGRWTSPDPMGYVDGGNLYEYVASASIGFTDPSGYGKHPMAQNIVFTSKGRGSRIMLRQANGQFRWISKAEFAKRWNSGSFTGRQQRWLTGFIASRAFEAGISIFYQWVSSEIINGVQDIVTVRNIGDVCNLGGDWGHPNEFGEVLGHRGVAIGRKGGTKHLSADSPSVIDFLEAIVGWGAPIEPTYTPAAELSFYVNCRSARRELYWEIRQAIEWRVNGKQKVIKGDVIDFGIVTRGDVICACCQRIGQ